MERQRLLELARADFSERIPAEELEKALSTSPFVPFYSPGAVNFRDVGLASPGKIKPGMLFRSGALALWSDASKQKLAKEQHVKTIFDLRSRRERDRQPSPAIEGVETKWLPPTASPRALVLDAFIVDSGVPGFADMYEEVRHSLPFVLQAQARWLKLGQVATIHAPLYTALFRHIAQRPDDAILFHCSAGKDRTGVVAALLMRLAGVQDDVIGEDYAITRVGVEPVKETLAEMLGNGLGGIPRDAAGFKELSACNAEYMLGFLGRLDEKWGGAEGYLEKHLGFAKDDVEKIKSNIAA